MTDFVLEHPATFDYEWQLKKHLNYAKFLKQPLALWMFVPCDEYGNVLQEPKCMYIYNTQCFECSADEMRRCREYLQAKERCLFEGFEIKNNDELYYNDKLMSKDLEFQGITIENLVSKKLTLSQTAIKQLGL